MEIEVTGIKITVVKKCIKNLHLYVKPPDGHVEISAPNTMSDESISLFARTKIGWIRKQQEKFDKQERQTKREFVSGETIYVWGKPYYLHVEYSSTGNSLVLHGEDATLFVRKESTAKQREAWVNEWYRTILKEQIDLLLPKWEIVTDLHPTSWQTKNMTTRWGTCNTKTGKIWLNLQLAKKSIKCLDYVLLHELVHLKVHNHGKEFVAMMDEFMPYWRETKKLLNDSKLDYMPINDVKC